ncbi:hypothetical protein [Wukongibacter baidiensis]
MNRIFCVGMVFLEITKHTILKGKFMNALTIERIWEDVDFYEIAISIKGIDIYAKMPTYVNNEMIIELKDSLYKVGIGERENFHWESGEDKDNVSSYASMYTYKYNKQGKVCIDFILDNKAKKPYRKRLEFSIMTEPNALIEFSRKLNSFVIGNVNKIEGVYFASN